MSQRAGTIVVGIDGSASSQEALVWAATQAEAEQRPLTLVHAVPRTTPTLLDTSASDPRQARDLALRAKGQEVLDAAQAQVRQLAPGVDVLTECRLEDPREVLIDLSRTAAMLVLGSRGRGPVKSLLLGSTAVAVVRLAQCPVVVHRPLLAATAARTGGIAVGVDSTEDSRAVLEVAFQQAALRDLPLTVVHTYWYFEQSSAIDPVSAEPELRQQARLALAQTLAGFAEKYPDVTVHTEVDQAMPERYLLRMTDQMDLLVVGAHHGSRAAQFMFGSVSVWLVEHARCPVAVVPLSVI